MEKRRPIAILLILCLCAPVINASIVSASSENWVEVIRFEGFSSIYGETDTFQCNYADWRINWEYVSNPSNPTVFKIDVLTKNDVTKKITLLQIMA